MINQFTQKLIEVTIWLNSGTVAAPVFNDADKKTYSGLRVIANIELLGMGQQSTANISIYGMSQSDINRLETTGSIQQQNTRINKIMIAAGEVGGAMYIVHEGFIDTAYPEITQPETKLTIFSATALDAQMKPVAASSYQGSVQVSVILADLAKEGNLTLNDLGVKKVMDNAYLTGNAIDKINTVCRAVDIEHNIKGTVLTIFEKQHVKDSGVVISAAVGSNPLMLGVPHCSSFELTVSTVFYTGFDLAKAVKVESTDHPNSTGMWQPQKITHLLECYTQNATANWKTVLQCTRTALYA